MLLALKPLNQLDPAPSGAGEWIATGNDPHFHMSWPSGQPIPGGHYVIRAHGAQNLEYLIGSCIYVDCGHGLREDDKVALQFFSRRGGRSVAFITLPDGVTRMRWDPSTAPARFKVDRLTLRRLSMPIWHLRALLVLFDHHIQAKHSPAGLWRIFWRVLSTEGVAGLRSRLRRLVSSSKPGQQKAYADWVREHDTFSEAELARIADKATALPVRPRISVVMPVYNTPEPLLREAIASVRAQAYDNWELCIADDKSTAPHVRSVLEAESAADPRIKIAWRQTNGHISEASNSALALATGDWVAMLDHDDLLRPHALYCLAEAINRRPDAEIIYSDEDKIDGNGERFDPYFKPDFSIDLFYGQNYLNHLTAHRRANIAAVDGWRKGFEGSQDYDLTLRILERVDANRIVHIPLVLYHWRAAEGSTARDIGEKGYAFHAGFRALEDHIGRMGLAARVAEVPGTPYYRVRYEAPAPQPLVSIIIPTRDGAAILDQCLTSLFTGRSYENIEVIVVDNGSVEAETFALFQRWQGQEPRLRVLAYDQPFNYSAINNFAVAQASGEFVCLMNNDIEIIDRDWLSEMMSFAVQPDVGCVGAKLLYPNGQIQHAGVVLGVGGVAGHSHKFAAGDAPGYFSHLLLPRTVSAVTAACLVVRKAIYEEVGGLDAEALAVAFNDVDFCIKVRNAGYRNVWTPFARMIHHESLTRGAETTPEKKARFTSEVRTMMARWGVQLLEDPFYSPNLTLMAEDHSLAFPPRAPKPW
jgi:glycosyltransferase involved in cell wall biosynthesis